MKMRTNWLLIPTVALGLGACDGNKSVKAPETATEKTAAAAAPVATAPETPAKEAPAPVAKVPGLSVEERAAKLGFSKYLPQDTEVVYSFYNGTKVADRMMKTKIWNLIQKEMGGGMMGAGGLNLDALEPELPEAEQGDDATADAKLGNVGDPKADEAMGPAALVGTEVTLAMGKTTSEQIGSALKMYRRMGYFQMRNLAKALVVAAKSGDPNSIEESMESQMGPEMIKDLLKDPESGMGVIEKLQMPPIYVAFKTSESGRAAAAQQVASAAGFLDMMEGMTEPLKFEVSGHTFEGAKLLGSKVSEKMVEDRKEMEDLIGAATVDQLIAAMAKKDLVVVSGTVGDYVVLFIGSSKDDLKIATDSASSLVGSAALAFSDAYASKDTAALIYGNKESADVMIKATGGLSDITNGLRDGIAGSEGLGDTRDLETLFQLVAERETALRKLMSVDSTGMVAYFEEGLKIECFGGSDSGMVDWKATNKLGHLGKSEDVLMFADLTKDAAFDEKSQAYVEALMQTAYAMTMKASELPMDNPDMAQFKEMSKLFDTKFRPDLIALWEAFSNDFGSSLGNESALVVDLKGAAPAIPGIPQPVLDKAKIPRISLIAPVTDRTKLSGSWDKMNATVTSVLGKISEISGAEIPMQKPLSSEKNGNSTWFFPMPFLADDFLPSVTVGDKWFVASSSKIQALDLISQADTSGETNTGMTFTFNFKTLHKYAQDTLKLVDENAEALMGSPLSKNDKKVAEEAISVLGDLDMLTVRSYREGGKMRSSVHFKTR